MKRYLFLILVFFIHTGTLKSQESQNSGLIIGEDAPCLGWEIPYSIDPQSGAIQYLWKHSFPLVVSWNDQDPSDPFVIATFQEKKSGYIKVSIVYPNYTIDYDSLFVTVIEAPGKNNPKGKDSLCEGQSYDSVLYFVNLTDATTYIWDFSEVSGIIISDSTKDSVYVDFPTSPTPGLIKVTGINKCGAGTESDGLQLIILEQPTPFILNNHGDTVCKNSQFYYFADDNYSSYFWETESRDSIIGDHDKDSVLVRWNNEGGAGILKLTVTNAQECAGTTTLQVTKDTLEAPLPPEIWLFGYNMLVCSDSTAGSYQWYYNGAPTGSADTLAYYFADLNKPYDYTVEICNGKCCNRSSPFYFPSSVNENEIKDFTIYPNPANSRIFIRPNDKAISRFDYKIFSQLGVVLKSGSGHKDTAEVDISNLSPGLYFLSVWSGKPGWFSTLITKY